MFIGTVTIEGREFDIKYAEAQDYFYTTMGNGQITAESRKALLEKLKTTLFYDALEKSPSRQVYTHYATPVDKYTDEWHHEQVTLYQYKDAIWMQQSGQNIKYAKNIGAWDKEEVSIDTIQLPCNVRIGGWLYTLMPPAFEEYYNRVMTKLEVARELVDSACPHLATATIEQFNSAIDQLNQVYEIFTKDDNNVHSTE